MIELLRAAAERVPFTTHLFRAELEDPSAQAAYPYVVLWSDLGHEFSGDDPWTDSLCDTPHQAEFTIRATYVGLTVDAVDVVARRTRQALNRAALEADGWHCDRLRMAPAMGIDSDESVQLRHGHPYYAVDEYRLIAAKETAA